MTNLIAYHGMQAEKSAILAQLLAHHDADEIVKGKYWGDGKGCAVGCTIHSDVHAEYEPRFGIPQMLARLEDAIFEGLPNGKAKEWPIRFMSAIEPGADLSLVGWKFLHWLLTDETVNPGISHPLVRDAVKQCAVIVGGLASGGAVSKSAAWSAAESAWRAAESAWSAAESAWRAAESAWRAAESAWSAAESAWRAAESAWRAAESAWSAAESAWRAAESAAESAWHAAESAWRAAESAAESAWRAARSAAYERMAEKLIELVTAAPIHGEVQ